MLRRLFTFLSLLSLLLCVGTCVLWVRSYWAMDTFKFSGDRTVSVTWSRGLLRLFGTDLGTRPDLQVSEPHRRADPIDLSPLPPGPGWGNVGMRGRFKAGGFSWYHSAGGVYVSPKHPFDAITLYPAWQFTLPIWVPALLFGILPAAVAFRPRRQTTACVECGYDLRATPDRCPECGALPKSVPISN